MSKVYNFSPGPGILPQAVIASTAQAIQNFAGTGLSLMEVSHRGAEFEAVLAEAVFLVREQLGVPETHEIVFLQGGASLQFAMVPMNLLDEGDQAAYLDTGVWASKAIKEAKLFGKIEVVASSKDRNYCYIPKNYTVPSKAKYFHITSNNTIFGTQLQQFPNSSVPLVCDMSSDIFSRPVTVSDFGIIYAGAQKNMGPAGVTLAIVRKDLLGKVKRTLPSMLDYRIHIENGSMYNTPPCVPIFVVRETLKWLKAKGGVSAMQKLNEEKANLLYQELEQNDLFKATADAADRSRMNVTFVMNDSSLEKDFLKFSEARGLSGLKGHRSVGGFRASIYNALEKDGIDALVSAMRDFKNGKR